MVLSELFLVDTSGYHPSETIRPPNRFMAFLTTRNHAERTVDFAPRTVPSKRSNMGQFSRLIGALWPWSNTRSRPSSPVAWCMATMQLRWVRAKSNSPTRVPQARRRSISLRLWKSSSVRPLV